MPAVILRFVALLVPILTLFVLAAGYDDSARARTATPNGPQYSPFLVEVNGGGMLFEHITFKDVGMSIPPEDRAFVYETIAESLSARLGEDAGMSLDVQVLYSDAADAPGRTHHRACESNHVYVDLWRDASSPKWGYSLRSGCGEEAQFAWRELAATGPDPVITVEPLTRDIVADLAHAVATGCFTKHC